MKSYVQVFNERVNSINLTFYFTELLFYKSSKDKFSSEKISGKRKSLFLTKNTPKKLFIIKSAFEYESPIKDINQTLINFT